MKLRSHYDGALAFPAPLETSLNSVGHHYGAIQAASQPTSQPPIHVVQPILQVAAPASAKEVHTSLFTREAASQAASQPANLPTTDPPQNLQGSPTQNAFQGCLNKEAAALASQLFGLYTNFQSNQTLQTKVT
jgi:hypothetical protein